MDDVRDTLGAASKCQTCKSKGAAVIDGQHKNVCMNRTVCSNGPHSACFFHVLEGFLVVDCPFHEEKNANKK